MKLIVGFFWGAITASFWFLTFFVKNDFYFGIPAIIGSMTMLFYIIITIMQNWDK